MILDMLGTKLGMSSTKHLVQYSTLVILPQLPRYCLLHALRNSPGSVCTCISMHDITNPLSEFLLLMTLSRHCLLPLLMASRDTCVSDHANKQVQALGFLGPGQR